MRRSDLVVRVLSVPVAILASLVAFGVWAVGGPPWPYLPILGVMPWVAVWAAFTNRYLAAGFAYGLTSASLVLEGARDQGGIETWLWLSSIPLALAILAFISAGQRLRMSDHSDGKRDA